jgi:hypothetical protein
VRKVIHRPVGEPLNTPLRRVLDRELSAGAEPLRDSYRAQHRVHHVLLPPPGVGTEGGTVGTAIDQRLRLAFTAAAPVDDAALIGIDLTGGIGGRGAKVPGRVPASARAHSALPRTMVRTGTLEGFGAGHAVRLAQADPCTVLTLAAWIEPPFGTSAARPAPLLSRARTGRSQGTLTR